MHTYKLNIKGGNYAQNVHMLIFLINNNIFHKWKFKCSTVNNLTTEITLQHSSPGPPNEIGYV